jgi:hypothetical protein
MTNKKLAVTIIVSPFGRTAQGLGKIIIKFPLPFGTECVENKTRLARDKYIIDLKGKLRT